MKKNSIKTNTHTLRYPPNDSDMAVDSDMSTTDSGLIYEVNDSDDENDVAVNLTGDDDIDKVDIMDVFNYGVVMGVFNYGVMSTSDENYVWPTL